MHCSDTIFFFTERVENEYLHFSTHDTDTEYIIRLLHIIVLTHIYIYMISKSLCCKATLEERAEFCIKSLSSIA